MAEPEPPKEPINPKVHAAAAGGVGGLTVGKAISSLLMFYFLNDAPEKIAWAWDYLIQYGVMIAGIYILAYKKAT